MATIMRVGGGAGGGGETKNPAVSTLKEKDIILVTENGIPVEYYIDKHGYEPTLNGNNRTLITRKEGAKTAGIDAQSVNTYDGCDMDIWFNGEFYNGLSDAVRDLVSATRFPYTIGGGNATVTTLSRAVFALSVGELGFSDGNAEGTALPIASTLKICSINGTAIAQWTRSAFPSNNQNFYCVDAGGGINVFGNTSAYAYRPSMTIPNDTKVIGPDNYGRYTLECEAVGDVYGIARDITASSPEWVRTDGAMTFSAKASVGTVAGASDFDNVYPWSEMQRVTLDSGDVMVRIPKFYYGRYRNGNIERIQISGRADVGLSLHPAFNHGGVEADCIYVGAYKLGTGDSSKSGVAPVTGYTRAGMRMSARTKGTGWGLIDISTLSAIQMLYLVEFANNNSQAMIGRGYTDGNSGKINTGSCDNVPNLTGRPTGTDGKTDIVYRGIEGIWGNIWEFVDGINWNGGTYYVCNDPSKYADDTATNYAALSFTCPTNWAAGAYIVTEGLDAGINPHIMTPATGGGSEATYYCDFAWTATGWLVYGHGGSRADGSICGLFTANVTLASSGSHAIFGSRLIYIPQ